MATRAALMPGTVARPTSIVWSWVTTVDHKRIGILYGITAFGFFLLGGLGALVVRAQLARPENTLVGAAYNELFNMHGTTMIFLAVMPLSTRADQLHGAAAHRLARRGGGCGRVSPSRMPALPQRWRRAILAPRAGDRPVDPPPARVLMWPSPSSHGAVVSESS